MAVSLKLPYQLCIRATRLAKRISQSSTAAKAIAHNRRAYFRWQYETTRRFHDRYWQSIDFRERTVFDIGSGLGGRAAYFIEQGAAQVYCIDINVSELDAGANYTAEMFPAAAARIKFFHPNDVPEAESA